MAIGKVRPASPPGRTRLHRDRRDRWLVVAAVLVAVGVAVRIASFWTHGLGIDANRYAVMGQSWATDRTFTMPWGDVYSPGGGPEPSHHYPPAYPVYLGLVYEVLGFSEAATKVAAIAVALLAIAVTYLCTRDLYGRRPAALVTAVVAVSPLHVLATTQGYSENLLLALFVGTMWAILRSLDRPPFILLAGALAALGYLTRSSVGGFFVIAGLGGLAWRLRWHGWAALRNPWYLAAIGLFGTAVVAWGLRNWRHFGTWQTSSHTAEAYSVALGAPVDVGGADGRLPRVPRRHGLPAAHGRAAVAAAPARPAEPARRAFLRARAGRRPAARARRPGAGGAVDPRGAVLLLQRPLRRLRHRAGRVAADAARRPRRARRAARR